MQHQILPGSISLDDGIITAGVHTGASEWEIQDLRYVQANIKDGQPGESVLAFMGHVYDDSEGCLTKGDFRRK